MTVHQILPTWEPGAIGAHAVEVARALSAAGIECVTWADDIRPGLPGVARPTAELLVDRSPKRGDVLLFHTAMGTATAEVLLARPEPLVVDHHNVTPPHYFDAWEPALAENLEVAQRQVARLARRAVLGLADSTFNARDLERDGCRNTAVVPVMADYARFENPDHPTFRDEGAVWLFVGRLAPNKAQHDVVRAFAWYRAAYDAGARLRLVGSAPFDGYSAAVHRLIDRLGLHDAVMLTGPVSDEALAGHYHSADVYVSCSSHEGFAVPVVEAMAAGVPVVALAAAAVPETSGGAALLVDHVDPALIATAVARLRRDEHVRGELVAAGRARAAALAPERSATALVAALAPIVGQS